MKLANYLLVLDVILSTLFNWSFNTSKTKHGKGSCSCFSCLCNPKSLFCLPQAMLQSSQFIMSVSKYFEGGNHGHGVGMISRMQHGSEDSSHVRRTNDLDQISLSEGQQTTNLMLEEDQYMQESEAVLDCAQSTMIDLEIRQQTIGSLNNIHCFPL